MEEWVLSKGEVSKSLREKRFSQKYRHTNNVQKYDREIWNSNDVQFFALWQERYWNRTTLTQHNLIVSLDLFAWTTGLHNPKEQLDKQGTLRILPEQTSPLWEFLTHKPTDETFTLAWGRYGAFHLSFEKRGLFGQTELSWKFLFPKEKWDETLFLPSKERKTVRKDMKEDEQRQHFWFTFKEADYLASYLEFILP